MGDLARTSRAARKPQEEEDPLIALARVYGKLADAHTRQQIARIHGLTAVNKWNTQRPRYPPGRCRHPPLLRQAVHVTDPARDRAGQTDIIGAGPCWPVRIIPMATPSRSGRSTPASRRSAAARTRFSATSSASGCLACRRNRIPIATRRSGICRTGSNDLAADHCRGHQAGVEFSQHLFRRTGEHAQVARFPGATRRGSAGRSGPARNPRSAASRWDLFGRTSIAPLRVRRRTAARIDATGPRRRTVRPSTPRAPRVDQQQPATGHGVAPQALRRGTRPHARRRSSAEVTTVIPRSAGRRCSRPARRRHVRCGRRAAHPGIPQGGDADHKVDCR